MDKKVFTELLTIYLKLSLAYKTKNPDISPKEILIVMEDLKDLMRKYKPE